MNKLMQEAPQSFRGRLFRQDSAKPKERQIMVLRTGLAGAKFYVQNEEEREKINNLAPGTELLLYREPDNEHDEWAIAVYLTEDDQIGYVTKFKNETIARLMDAGKKFVAITDDPEERLEKYPEEERARRRAHWAATENVNLPFSIYMVEND
jgi:hypothetical protein